MGLHHLTDKDGDGNHRLHTFEKTIIEVLLPAFRSLITAQQTQVIWLKQFSMLPDKKHFKSEW